MGILWRFSTSSYSINKYHIDSLVQNCSISSANNIGLDNGLAPTRRQAIIWTSDISTGDTEVVH